MTEDGYYTSNMRTLLGMEQHLAHESPE